MKYLLLFIVIYIVSILCTGCAQRAIENHSNRSDTQFNSTLWMQSSSEFKASSLQTYNTATGNLKKIVKTTTETAAIEQTAPYASLPSAVIMDIDETVLDSSRYEANLILTADSYSSTTWDDWIALQQATAIPGAVHFINYARRHGSRSYIHNKSIV